MSTLHAVRPGNQPTHGLNVDADITWAGAACVGEDSEIWFADVFQAPTPGARETNAAREARLLDINRAKTICRSCPLLARCDAWAKANPTLTAWGIWAGKSARERKAGTTPQDRGYTGRGDKQRRQT
jgi:hypothetical protein